MKGWGSAAAVIAAVREDASAEAERLQRDADAQLSAAAEPPPAAADAGERLAGARRRVADAEAAEDWEDSVAAAADRDAWIASVAEAGRARLAGDPRAAEWLEALAAEAVRQLPGPAAVLSVPEALAPAAGALRPALERACGKPIAIEAVPLAFGCVARTPDGRVRFDNTVEARERRTRTEWRAAVARVYDAAIAETVAAG